MSDINRFNLIDEPWIPIVGLPSVSLRQLFTEPGLELAGTAVQKIALLKLLLAIAQAAYTPKDDQDWKNLGVDGIAKRCLAYLDQKREKFYLYGSKPFLQMPAIKKAKKVSFGAVMPEIAINNTTVLTQSQVERILSDAEKAILLVTLMGFSLGNKRVDKTVALSDGHEKKTGKPGANLGFKGYLHHFLSGGSCLENLWLNLFTLDGVREIKVLDGIGTPPWEEMPEGEVCTRANKFKNTLMGKLVPLSKFCLFADSGIHYSDGIEHPSILEGGIDPSVGISHQPKKIEIIWTDPSKRPWRVLSSMLGFLSNRNRNSWDCIQLRQGLARIREAEIPLIGIWSAGLKVSFNAGEQYVSGADDFVESKIELYSQWLGERWFIQLEAEMSRLDELSKELDRSVKGYFKEQKFQKADGEKRAKKALHLFWQFCEKEFQTLLEVCAESDLEEGRIKIWRKYIAHCETSFDVICPKETARQLTTWAKYRSNLSKFINKGAKKKI